MTEITLMLERIHVCYDKITFILVPRAHDPSDLQQGSRALAGPDFLSMCRVFVSYSQPIRFTRLDGKSVNCGLPVSDKARALDPCRRSEGSWLWGRECYHISLFINNSTFLVITEKIHMIMTLL